MRRITMIKTIIPIILLSCLSFSTPLFSGTYSFSGYLPKVERQAEILTIKINALAVDKDFYIYYRTEGLLNYQVRKMKVDKNGNMYFQLSTANLYGKTMEYYILESGKNNSTAISPVFTVNNISRMDSPEIYFQQTAEGTAGTGSSKEALIKIGLSASTTTRIYEKAEPPTGQKFDANGNLRLYRNIVREKYQLDFDTNFSYMHTVSADQNKVNLADMKINFKTGIHTVAAGDLSISNTEFTTSSLSRRGMHYELAGKSLYLSSFFTNSQQKTGFAGFGIPPSNANLFGATAGFNLGTIFKLRGMFLTGKDNLDSLTIVSSEDPYREGHVLSAWSELNLWQNHLLLKGEFASSNYGSGADSSALTKKTGKAWRAEGDFNYKIFTLHADYKKIGEQFSSIANLFLQNDREGLNSSIGMMIKSFSLNVRYADQKTNLTSTVQPKMHTKNISTDLSWLIANHFQIGAEFGLDNLDYDKSSGLMTGSEDMDTIRYSGTVGYIAGSNGLTVKIGKTESKNFTANIDGSVSLNLRFGNVFSLNPTVSYQSTENFTDSSTSKIYSAYINSELSFVPEIFSLSMTGSWTKNDNTFSDSTSLSVGGNFNFYMAKIFKNKIQPTLSLRGKYDEFTTGGTKTDNITAYLQADISF